MPAPLDILGSAEDGGGGRRVLQGGVHGCSCSDAGRPNFPTIFNVVVDAVVHLWVSDMVEGAEERGKRRQGGRYKNSLFYADDGMVAESDPR